MLTIEEAIRHCEEKAESLFKEANVNAKNITVEEYLDCKECAREHVQLASWLAELKNRREKDSTKTNGYWIAKKVDNSHYHYFCNNCNYKSKYQKTNFCPNCGRKMEI